MKACFRCKSIRVRSDIVRDHHYIVGVRIKDRRIHNGGCADEVSLSIYGLHLKKCLQESRIYDRTQGADISVFI